MRPINLVSLFSGIGAFEKALDNLAVDFNLVNFCEFDKYAVKSYCAIHGVDESKNLGDITKVDESKLPKDIDVLTYGFPCQDISLSGKQKGLFNDDGSLTRSGLFFEALRIIEATKPKIAIAENVKNLTSKKFAEQFKIVLESIEQAGYNNYWKVLNAKDYGVPQNRERVFIVSIRKDIDTGAFEFPEGFPLEKRLKDVLEDDVDEKFYVPVETVSRIITDKNGVALLYDPAQSKREGKAREYNDVAPTLTSRGYKDPRLINADLIQVGQIYKNGNSQACRIHDPEGLSPTMDTCTGGNRMPKVIVREATKIGYAEAVEGDSINLEQPNSKTRLGRVGKQVAQTLTTSCNQAVVQKIGNIYPSGGENGNVYLDGGLSPTLKAGTGVKGNGIGSCNAPKIVQSDSLRIRKLTPKECFRLMGFDDADFEKAESVNSNTQLYKQAGNSIVVPVVENIFLELMRASILTNCGKRRE